MTDVGRSKVVGPDRSFIIYEEASNLYNSAACDRVFDAEVDDNVFERTAAVCAAVEI